MRPRPAKRKASKIMFEKDYEVFLSKPTSIVGPFKIYEIKDIVTCMEVSVGTSWCIRNEKYATGCLKEGSLWMVMKDDEKYALFDFENSQFVNVNNRKAYVSEVKYIFDNWRYGKELLEKKIYRNGCLIEYVNKPSEELCLVAVRQNGRALEFIEEQTEEMCLVALENDANALMFVKNQTEELCKKAVDKDLQVLRCVDKNILRSWEYGYKLIEENVLIEFIYQPSYELCMEAVKRRGTDLRFVDQGYAYGYSNMQTDEMCLAAVKQNWFALEYVKKQTYKVCLAAVLKNGNAIAFVVDQKIDLCLTAIENDPSCIEYIREQTVELCLKAINKDYRTLRNIKDQTLQLCIEAVKINSTAIRFIRDKDMVEEVRKHLQ